MRLKKIYLLCIIGFSLIVVANCTSSTHQKAESARASMTHHQKVKHSKTNRSLKAAEVQLEPGKVYEVTFFSIKEGKMTIMNEDYFPKAMPILTEYGAKNLGMFKVVAKKGGEMQRPQMIALFEWPSLTAMHNLHNDPRMRSLGKIRDSSISFFRQAFHKVEKETTIVFRSDKTYEFFAAWLNPNSGPTLGKYFKASEPMKKRHGPPVFKVMLSPLKEAPDKNHILKPGMAGIVEWPSTQTYYELKDDYEFATKAAPLLNQAVARLDMIHAKFIFQR